MLSPTALDQWQRQAHGPRVQAKAIAGVDDGAAQEKERGVGFRVY